MKNDVIIVCEDLFGLEVYSILNDINKYIEREKIEYDTYKVKGFLTDNTNLFYNLNIREPVIQGIGSWKPLPGISLVMGIKDPNNKRKAAEVLKNQGAKFITILTPWTLTPYNMNVGEGCVISNYSFKDGAVFAPFVTMINVMSGAAHVGEYTTIDSLANITNAEIGRCVYIGSHAFLMEHKKIGDNSYIFPGSMIFGNIKPGTKVAGIPANKAMFKRLTEEIASVKQKGVYNDKS